MFFCGIQSCLDSKQIYVIDGKAAFSKRRGIRTTDNGSKVGGLNTIKFNKQCLNVFYEKLYSICPINRYGNHTMWKDGMQTLLSYLYFLVNNKMGQGFCPFHASTLCNVNWDICRSYNYELHNMSVFF